MSVQTRWGVGKRPGNPFNRKVVKEVCQIPGGTVYVYYYTRRVRRTRPRGCNEPSGRKREGERTKGTKASRVRKHEGDEGVWPTQWTQHGTLKEKAAGAPFP